ncbi:MAG: acyl-homoserine-lactone synthase [Pseudomonadota bacterium]
MLDRLGHEMYLDRAAQFRFRLGWNVQLDENGYEKDEYDERNPIYIILSDSAGTHRASMRFLPTTEKVMVNEAFADKTGVEIRSPLIWECTRFCLSPTATREDSTRLLLGTLELGLIFGLSYFVGVFENRMLRVYKNIGWSPEILGYDTLDRNGTSVGIWWVDASQKDCFSSRLDLSPNWEINRVGDVLSRPDRTENLLLN